MVNLVFNLESHASLNLQGELESGEDKSNGRRAIQVRITHRKDIDWMMDQKLVNAPCCLEFSDGTRQRAIFQSLANLEEGFILQGHVQNPKSSKRLK